VAAVVDEDDDDVLLQAKPSAAPATRIGASERAKRELFTGAFEPWRASECREQNENR